MPTDASNPGAVAEAQVAEIANFEVSLHGHPAQAWGPYRDVQRAAAALGPLAEQRAAEIAALQANDTLPLDHRRAETARLRAAAEQELRDVHAEATTSAARLEAHLRGALVPQPDPIPANRQMAREELRLAVEGAPNHLDAITAVLLTARPAVVAELHTDYGRLLLGPEAAKVYDQVAIGTLRRRGGHDEASRLANHALNQYERLKIPGRVDAAFTAAALVLQAPPK